VNSTGPSHSERGAALLIALITAALIAAIAASLIVSTSTDLMITGSYRSSAEAMYGVEAGMERAIDELAAVTGYFGHPEPPERVIPSTTGQPQTSRGGEDVTVIRSGTTPDTARGTT